MHYQFAIGYSMNQTFILEHLPCDLNTYIRHERTNKFIAADVKKRETNTVYMECIAAGLKPVKKPVTLHFHWYTKNEKKDPDNIAFGKKFILDGMVLARVLQNDGRAQIIGFSDHFYTDNCEQVIVDIIEED